jgi:hypothetical protein
MTITEIKDSRGGSSFRDRDYLYRCLPLNDPPEMEASQDLSSWNFGPTQQDQISI